MPPPVFAKAHRWYVHDHKVSFCVDTKTWWLFDEKPAFGKNNILPKEK
jgi:hypothetical protein